MKIRLDFVTNSSSSSFVTYNLTDSEFCRYLSAKMKELGLEYEEYCYDRPASRMAFDENSLDADISCVEEEVYCNNYLPEVWSPTFDFKRLMSPRHGYKNGIIVEIVHHIKDEYIRYLYMALLRDIFGYKTRRYKSIGRVIEDTIRKNLSGWDDGSQHYLTGYTAVKIETDEGKRIASRLDAFMRKHKDSFDNRLTVTDKFCMIQIPTGKNTHDVVYVSKDCIIIGNSDGYTKDEKDEDIEYMTDIFIRVVSDFLPIKDLPASDRIKLQSLYMDDLRKGKLNCDVYMGYTD